VGGGGGGERGAESNQFVLLNSRKLLELLLRRAPD
jgi:hypothetical protein